ncbi:hypothetical protein RhiJN_00404 [Ceratobasidium sp. AG-Ba]|nr:hypothetical protein RhiJN_00404 [Ceratobasidium sp. AG-Ba]
MAAIAQFGGSSYNASIILASPTCKTEKHGKKAELIGIILDSWRKSPHGSVVHGDIWCICTDGDAARRIAIFQHCMTFTLQPSSKLYSLLGHLPLLNLCCGPNSITHDGDYKHEEKRMASALHSRSGIIVNGTQITPKMLVHYLRQLEDLPESRILSFFDGTDPQNVPKANALLTSIHRASQLPVLLSQSAHKPFVLLGEVLGSFVLPYTTTTMSLKEQLINLAKCAHLMFALYRIDGTRFMTGQLIYDIQASIKNVFFCVAKTQLVNPGLPFYLLQTGTDRLEARFGTFRTVTSNRNGDILQICERAASAQHIDEIFSARPRWNRVPYRLSLDGSSGVDHTNPASWSGDVTVGNVNLYSCWIDGCLQASKILDWAGVRYEFDPAILSTESPHIDLMRPTGKYPGIQVDTKEPEIQPAQLAELTEDDQTIIAQPTDQPNDLAQPLQLGNDELSLEHLLPANPDDVAKSTTKRGWISVDGHRVHLESAVRYMLGSEGGPRSTDRLRRICGYTRYLNPSADSQSVLGSDFHVSELVATFLYTQSRVSVAIIRVTNIVAQDGRMVESIAEKHFNETGVTLSGQILILEYNSGVWYWTQKYDTIANTAASAHRKRSSGADFCASFSLPVNPSLTEWRGERVWSFEEAQMRVLMDDLWQKCAGNAPEDHIPTCQASALFPYRSSSSTICSTTYIISPRSY